MIASLTDLMRYYDVDSYDQEATRRLVRAVYDATECGATLEVNEDGVGLYAAVEGSDGLTAQFLLKYPFTTETWSRTMLAVEMQANRIWYQASDTVRASAGFTHRDIIVGAFVTNDANGTRYGLEFQSKSTGLRFELQGDPDQLDDALNDARKALAEQRRMTDEAMAAMTEMEDAARPDDHPGFDPSFLTY